MKKYASLILVLAVLFLGALILALVSNEDEGVEPEANLSEEEEYWTENVWETTRQRVGQPIEGYEPFMLLQAYQGLAESDFDEVLALQGIYYYRNNKVEFEFESDDPIHTAARAISKEGMAILLRNVAERLDIEVDSTEDVNNILSQIDTQIDNREIEGEQNSNNNANSPEDDETYACTLDAKLCPDGSAVGRSGPNCSFKFCPNEVEAGYRTCPDKWIKNMMPGIVGQNDKPREYFIIDGKRWEVADFDMNWVEANCEVEVEAVY